MLKFSVNKLKLVDYEKHMLKNSLFCFAYAYRAQSKKPKSSNPNNFAKLARSDRQAIKIHSAVCSGPGTVRMTIGGSEEAADVDALPKPWVNRLLDRKKLANTTIDVPCRSLTSIIRDAGFMK